METGERPRCQVLKRLDLSSTSGYLSSLEAEASNYGTPSCPWVIQADPGQRVRLKLLNFGRLAASPSRDCYEMVVVKEGERSRRSITSCEESSRDEAMFESEGSEVTVEFVTSTKLEKLPKFMIHYESE